MKKIFFKFKIITLTLFLFFYTAELYCEAIHSPTWGYALDLPEGYILTDKQENSRYLFQHSIFPADLQIALYPRKNFKTAIKTSENIFSQLKIKHKDISFEWRNKEAILSMVEFSAPQQNNNKEKALAGWLLTLELPNEKGWLSLFAYTDKKNAKTYEALMISSLDMVFTDPLSYFEPGPVTSALYPKTGEKKIDYLFNNKKISFKVDSSDAEANKSVIDREFELLTGYLNKPQVIAAWKRYYKVIFKDAWSRIYSATSAIHAAFSNYKSHPTPEELSKQVLFFVQNFQYERDRAGSDFMNLPQALLEKRGDCDSRAMLMILMLKQMNIDAVLFISPNKSHSVAGVDCSNENGLCFMHNHKNYILAETTAHVKLGQIAEDMTDPSNWFAVEFYSVTNFQ